MIADARTNMVLNRPVHVLTDHAVRATDEGSILLWNVVLARASSYVALSSSSLSSVIEEEVEQALRISGLLQNYKCSNVAEVHSYLTAHPQLIVLLEEAPL